MGEKRGPCPQGAPGLRKKPNYAPKKVLIYWEKGNTPLGSSQTGRTDTVCLSWWIPNLTRGTQTLSLQSFQSHRGDAAGALGPLLISLTTGLFINTSLTHDRALTSLPEEGAMSLGAHCHAQCLVVSGRGAISIIEFSCSRRDPDLGLRTQYSHHWLGRMRRMRTPRRPGPLTITNHIALNTR